MLATERLLEQARELGWAGRFVHVSSFAVYGFNQVPRGGGGPGDDDIPF